MSIIVGSCKKNIPNNYLSANEKNLVIHNLQRTIESCGVHVKTIEHKMDEILWLRDIFVIIDNKCIICNLTTVDSMSKDRSMEYFSVVRHLFSKYKLEYLPNDVKLEGGDIIENGDDIFVGIGERTNEAALDYIQYLFPTKNVIPIRHTDMHLDCVLSVISMNRILFSKRRTYFEKNGYMSKYTLYDIDTDSEDGYGDNDKLVTNFLIVGNNVIHSQRRENKKVIDLLKQFGYRVHIVDIKDIWKEGGGIRCMTQWSQKMSEQIIY